jgi:hypothetical protein
MRREASRVSFLMCPFCVRALSSVLATPLRSIVRRATSGVTGRCGATDYTGYDPELPVTACVLALPHLTSRRATGVSCAGERKRLSASYTALIRTRRLRLAP